MKKITKKLGTLLLSAMVFGGTATMLFPERVEIAQAGVSNKTLVNNTTLFSKDEINKLDFIIGNGIEAVSNITGKFNVLELIFTKWYIGCII